MFPHVSLSAITEDLQHSGSLEATVENILEGAVHDHPAPPMFTSDELADDGHGWSRPAAESDDGREQYHHQDDRSVAPRASRVIGGDRGHRWRQLCRLNHGIMYIGEVYR